MAKKGSDEGLPPHAITGKPFHGSENAYTPGVWGNGHPKHGDDIALLGTSDAPTDFFLI